MTQGNFVDAFELKRDSRSSSRQVYENLAVARARATFSTKWGSFFGSLLGSHFGPLWGSISGHFGTPLGALEVLFGLPWVPLVHSVGAFLALSCGPWTPCLHLQGALGRFVVVLLGL